MFLTFALLRQPLALAALIEPRTSQLMKLGLKFGGQMSCAAAKCHGAAQANPVNGRIAVPLRADPIRSSHDNLFTSGNLGRYSKVLHQVLEGRG